MQKPETNKIYFYDPNMDNGWLANFSFHGFEAANGVYYKTVEHFFQSRKFTNPILVERIMQTESPQEAKAIAKANVEHKRKDWDIAKQAIMYEGIKKKFSQHKDLHNLLLLTGDREIIENSCDDYYWGIGKKQDGLNIMGKLLCTLRDELKRAS